MGNIIGIHTQTGALIAYTADPTQADLAGGILLLHDLWGLDDHTKNVADRLARQGYHVIAPSLLAGTMMEKQIRPELREMLFSQSRRIRTDAQAALGRTMAPLRSPQIASVAIIRAHAAFEFLFNMRATGGRVGVMGFGFGGTHALSLAIRDNRPMATVCYYPQANYNAYELRHITSPVMAFYGEHDQFSMPGLIRMRPQMSAAQVDFTPVVYDQSDSFFFDDSMSGAYDDQSAADSWSRAMSFFKRNMI